MPLGPREGAHSLLGSLSGGPDSSAGDDVVDWAREEAVNAGVPPERAKGLEFDAVLVVDPEAIAADGPRGAAELYVALTRATQRLGVLYRGEMPSYLDGLVDHAVSCS